MNHVRELPVALVRPNPAQPRQLFDADKLEQLAASIVEHGLLQPIRVRPAADGTFLLVCGERRWRAHGLAGRETILAIVEDCSDDDLADRAIVENMARADITPLEEARAFQARLDAGYSVDELARRLGIKQPHRITDRTALLRLVPEFQDALARDIITPSQASEMSTLNPVNQRVLFDAIGDGKCKTYSELRKVAGALRDAERQVGMFPADKPPTKAEVDTARSLERKIEQVAAIVGAGFDENELVILRKVNPLNADVLADKLECIEKAMKSLRLALRAASVRAKVA
jgi:ParB family chromosome partitioning protein